MSGAIGEVPVNTGEFGRSVPAEAVQHGGSAAHGARAQSAGQRQLVPVPAPPGISVSGNRPVDDYVSYTGLGEARMLNGALQMGTFTVCSPGQRALHVVLANTGRVRIEQTSERCV